MRPGQFARRRRAHPGILLDAAAFFQLIAKALLFAEKRSSTWLAAAYLPRETLYVFFGTLVFGTL